MPTHWIFAETVAHQPVQAVESLPHIYTLDADVDLGCWPQPEHHAPSTIRIRRASSASPNRQPLSIRRPLPSTSAKPAPDSASDSTWTLINCRWSAPRRRRCRLSVLRAIPACRQYSICVRPLVRYCSSSCSISSVLRRRAMPLVSAASGRPSRGLRQTLTKQRVSGNRLLTPDIPLAGLSQRLLVYP